MVRDQTKFLLRPDPYDIVFDLTIMDHPFKRLDVVEQVFDEPGSNLFVHDATVYVIT